MLSVEGQRALPSLLRRFETLKAVASSPASLASADTDTPWRRAKASIPSQMALCESMQPAEKRNVVS